MKRLVIYTIALLAWQITAAQVPSQLTESEMLLSGLKVVNSVKELPQQLDIPTAWVQTMREMAAKSKISSKENTEYGTCLNLIATGNTEDRALLLKEYTNLIKQRGDIPPENFVIKEKSLRAKIEFSDKSAIGGVKWNGGEIQKGNTPMKMHFIRGLEHCKGEGISFAHTHPDNGETFFSHADISAFAYNPSLKSMFAINNDEHTCAMINSVGKNQNTAFLDTFHTIMEAAPYLIIGIEHWKTKLSSIANQGNIAIYCGNINSPLKRFYAHDEKLIIPNELLIIGAKIQFNNFEIHKGDKGVIVTSELTPTLDTTFLAYLKEKINSDTNIFQPIKKPTLEPENINYLDIYRYSLFFNIDDEWKIFESKCLKGNKNSGTKCFQKTGFFRSNPDREYAYYDEKENYFLIIQNNNGRLNLIYSNPSKGINFNGDCIFLKEICIRHGRGIFDVKNEFKYTGDFENGEMKGDGIIESHLLNEVWQVKMLGDKNGGLEKIKRIR